MRRIMLHSALYSVPEFSVVEKKRDSFGLIIQLVRNALASAHDSACPPPPLAALSRGKTLAKLI